MTYVTPPLLLAVDAGGTSTRSVVVEATGCCLAYAVAGGGNPTAIGAPAAASSVAASAAEALRRADVPGRRIGLVVLAMAGARSTTSAGEVSSRLAELDVGAPAVFESDLLATYFSGTYQPDGYALVAGTGAAAIRIEGGEQVAVADALGWLLGDEGSGFWIGHRVVRAVLADLDGRGPATALTPLLLRRLDVPPAPPEGGDRPEIMALLRTMYAAAPVRLADFAALAFEAAGDETADQILRDAADALARTLAAVTSPSVTGPVVLGGGILSRSPRLAQRLVDVVGAVEVHTVVDGAVGAAVLALRHAGVVVDASAFDTLTSSLASLRQTTQ